MEWFKNFSRAIDYVESNLDKAISYEEAAKKACCSAYYFQRMFSYIAGIPLSEYIRRRRMTQAAFELQSTEQSVLEIALKYGYQSPTSFNRAFQSIHKISPAAARNRGNTLNAYPPVRFSIQVTGGEAMPYRMEEKEAVRIAGVCIPLTEDMEINRKIVPDFWKKILQSKQISVIRGLAREAPEKLLGVTAYQGPGKIDYYIAAATDMPVPDGMYEYQIPAALWVVFENRGPFRESVQNTFRRFLTERLPFTGYTYANLPDIEVYPSDKASENSCCQVWIAVKKETEEKNNGSK